MVHSASVPLWEALPRQRHYQLLPRGCVGKVPLPEFSPLLLTHTGGTTLSLLSDSSLSAADLPTFAVSTSTFLEHPPTEFFHQDVPQWPWNPCQSSADPRWKGAYQPNNPDLLAGNPPEAELLSFKGKKGDDIEHEQLAVKKHPLEAISLESRRTSQFLRTTDDSIRKWLLEAKSSSSEDKKEYRGYKLFIFEIYHQETISLNLNSVIKHSRKTGDFIKRSTGHEISAPREPFSESVRSTQASDYSPSILNGLVYGDIPVPEEIFYADLTDFIQQLVQKITALVPLLGLGDGCNDQQSVSYAPASGYSGTWFSHNQHSLSATGSWDQ